MNSRLLLVACALAACAVASLAAPAPDTAAAALAAQHRCPKGHIAIRGRCVDVILVDDYEDVGTEAYTIKPARAKRMVGMLSGLRGQSIYCPKNYYMLSNGSCVQMRKRPPPPPADYVSLFY